jgi:thiamine transporter
MKTNVKLMAEAGILVAFSLVLDYVSQFFPLKLWPQGGSINIALLPIVLFAVRNATSPKGITMSLLVGVASRSMVMLWAPNGIYHPLSAIFDYVLIGFFFGMVAVFYKLSRGSYAEWGIVLCGLLALGSHIVSGYLVFTAYMPDVYFGMEMTNMWVYSTIYNSTHMIPSIILTVFLFTLLPDRLKNSS